MPLNNRTNALYEREAGGMNTVVAANVPSPSNILKEGDVWGNEVLGTIIVTLASVVFLTNVQLAGWFRSLNRHDREQIAALFAGNHQLIMCWKISYLVSTIGMACTFLVFFAEGVFFFVGPVFVTTFLLNLYRNKKIFDVVSTRMFRDRRSLEYALILQGFVLIWLLGSAAILFLYLYGSMRPPDAESPLFTVHIVAIVGDTSAIFHAFVLEYFVWYRSFVVFFPIVEPGPIP